MKNTIKFIDAITGEASIKKSLSGKDFLTTKDSSSPSGQSLISQIEMTHSGIVTRNLGFYMPDNMKKGASTFTKHYKKPVLVGHDSDSDPVGRVIQADYIDTSAPLLIKDKYLKSHMDFLDKKKEAPKNGMIDFVQHVVREYSGNDSYRGLGHINGTLKITDPETIQKILDERYLTVSISMSSDSAFCSECGQDWVSEGPCEHERGQVYDSGVPVVLIPGKQSYNHVGIVSEPADQYAAGFKGIELIRNDEVEQLDSVILVKDNTFVDKFSIAANLFSYQDSKLISLSDETNTDLIEVKDSIQRLEDSLKTMENEKMKKGKFADQIGASISLFLYGEDGEFTSMEFKKYAETFSSEQLEELAKKAAAALASQDGIEGDVLNSAVHDYFVSQIPVINDKVTTEEVVVEPVVEIVTETLTDEVAVMKKVKVLNNRSKLVDGAEYDASVEDSILVEIQKIEGVNLTAKEAVELASLIARSQHEDALASLMIETKDKTVEESVRSYLESKDSKFKLTATSEEEVVHKMNDYLSDEFKVSFDSVVAKDCAGSGKYFPILNKACVVAAKKVLALTVASDSIRGRILENIEKISSKIVVEDSSEEVLVADNAVETTEIFDSTKTECDNQIELNDETLVAELTRLVQLATERGIIDSIIAPFLADVEQEIGVLEQQLLLANDEIEELLNSLTEVKDNSKKDLAEKVVDAKIKSGLFEVSDRQSEVERHLERTEDSLKDMVTDLEKAKVTKLSESEKVDSPVLADDSKSLNTQIIKDAEIKIDLSEDLKAKEIKRTYTLLKTNKGKPFADKWLVKQITTVNT
jgi:hypothetical protein